MSASDQGVDRGAQQGEIQAVRQGVNECVDQGTNQGANARPAFPFAALVGQAPLQQALLLAAIDPGLGGVLVTGPRGTAKSTAARALAELLPEGQLVNLPLGASEDRLIGTLDIETVLRDGAVRFSPGLLAKAHRGVLYVDEVNLLPDALVDALLDAAASGVNTVERDGVSHSHDASFVLIGTMNPEEGELRPQLIDRFGLMVELQNCFEPSVRQQIVKARLAFDLDSQGFRAAYAQQQALYVRQIQTARSTLPQLAFDDAVHARVSALCIGAAVDGLRADLVMLRAARALAALEQAAAVTVEHVDRVAEAVLVHRRHRREDSTQVETRDADAGRQGRSGGEVERRGAASSSAASAASAASSASSQGAGVSSFGAHASRGDSSEADWGYLPPEPAGTTQVKGVVPLSVKKR
ncbi:ATP-binding protein [Paraburkholderia bryophila]|uniref:Protoporphyrin IX magnesium-chelatase n=1 Tax=Paraburkholderia bryophila TaxID=420952 RepID=A0A329BIV2_9BURK|nr:AAA family ATPase [Paraburkholderia bryophila]RAS22148.1 protoporphyrin IX magnesium-chelatase [Paraburkholderia bryophila]